MYTAYIKVRIIKMLFILLINIGVEHSDESNPVVLKFD